jgi:hypothetical protein
MRRSVTHATASSSEQDLQKPASLRCSCCVDPGTRPGWLFRCAPQRASLRGLLPLTTARPAARFSPIRAIASLAKQHSSPASGKRRSQLVGDSPGGETMRAHITSVVQAGDAATATVAEGRILGNPVLHRLPHGGPHPRPLVHRQQEPRAHRGRATRSGVRGRTRLGASGSSGRLQPWTTVEEPPEQRAEAGDQTLEQAENPGE